MLNARQTRFQEQAHNIERSIKFLSAPVGSGKTEALIRHIRDHNQDNYIIVTPTRDLAEEIKNRLDIALVNSTEGENVSLMISDDNIPGSVRIRTLNAIRERHGDQSHTLIVTTENFRNLLPELADETRP